MMDSPMPEVRRSRSGVVQALLRAADRGVVDARHEADRCRLRIRQLELENERLRQALGDIREYVGGDNPDKDLLALGVIIRATDSGART